MCSDKIYGKEAPYSFSNLVEKLSPSVVNITTSSTVPNRQELNPQLVLSFQKIA